MNKWQWINIALAGLVVFVGFLGYIWGEWCYQAGDTAGYGRGTTYLETKVEAAWQEAYGEVAQSLGLPSTSSVDDVKSRLGELAVTQNLLRNPDSLAELDGFLKSNPLEGKTFNWFSYTDADGTRDFQVAARQAGFENRNCSADFERLPVLPRSRV